MYKKIWNAVILCMALTTVAGRANAQFGDVRLGVNGLTCSQCSRTVEMRLRKLGFVADVQMNLQHTEGKILLKKDMHADMEQIAQAVSDAGFSVRELQADFVLTNAASMSGSCLLYGGDDYIFVGVGNVPHSGTVTFKFVGKKFMTKNEFKKMQPLMTGQCEKSQGKTYYVTI